MSAPQELRAAVDRGFELHHSGATDEALATYEGVLQEARAATAPRDPVTVESLFAASFDRAVILAERGDLDGAADGFAEAARHPDPEDPDQRHEVAMARLNQGIALGLSGRLRAAAEVYGTTVEDFADADDAPTREQVTRAWVNLGAVHLESGDPEAAAATAEEILSHLQGTRDDWAAEQRDQAREILALATAAGDREVDQAGD